MRNTLVIALTIAAIPFLAHAQDGHSMAGHAMSTDMAGMSEEWKLPDACEGAVGDMNMAQMMDGAGDTTSGMDETQMANHATMMKMHAPMMRAAMIKDPDLAFNCGMIAHHYGAIAMSELELKMGKDEASREMARTIIEAQTKEIEEMTLRVEALAK